MYKKTSAGNVVSLLLFLLLCGLVGIQPAVSNQPASSERHPLLLISLDGFRADYFELANTPHLHEIMGEGVKADYLQSIFPSNTFPNHYSLVTGLYAENTGIIANSMYDEELGSFSLSNQDAVTDGRWYGGEPIWVTAEKQDVRTAAMFWPGSEAEIKGHRPSRWMPYDGGFEYRARVDTIISWIQIEDESRPDFMTLYFSRVDSRGHRYGGGSDFALHAAGYVDEIIGYLKEELERIGKWGEVNILITSDHGMATTSDDKVVLLDDIIDLDDVFVTNWSSVGMINPKEGKLDKVYRQLKNVEEYFGYTVYKNEDIPERYRFKNHPRSPQILLDMELPYMLTSRDFYQRRGMNAGTHGWDPEEPEMHAIFLGVGPDFKQGEQMPKVNMVDIYSLMCHLLGIEPAENDGKFEVWEAALR